MQSSSFLHLYVGCSLIMNSCYIEAALHNNHSVISYANEHTKDRILCWEKYANLDTHRSYLHNWNSCEIKAWENKTIQALKGHCHNKAHTITRDTNLRRVCLEFHVPFESLLSAFIWPFVCKDYHVYAVWRRCLLNTNTNTLLSSNLLAQLGCSSSHLLFVYFLSKQDCYGAKAVFVSSSLENPLSRKA